MKTKLLLFLFGVMILSLEAQVTHDLNWSIGVGSNVDLTIDVGDTVRWTWTDAFSHTVTRNGGTSSENFDSGTMTGNGLTYSFTFNAVGTNDYACSFHPSMSGTITVENNLSLNDKELHDFTISPNPSSNMLNISLKNSQKVRLEVFDVLGKQIYVSQLNTLTKPVDVSQWNSGVYLVRITSDTGSQTKRFVKQ